MELHSYSSICLQARYLFELGIDLKRVEIISDDYEAIADTVRRLSNQHDLVFTSGGIGKQCCYHE